MVRRVNGAGDALRSRTRVEWSTTPSVGPSLPGEVPKGDKGSSPIRVHPRNPWSASSRPRSVETVGWIQPFRGSVGIWQASDLAPCDSPCS